MTLKNKDGSTFTLTKPNPIMFQQRTWDKDKLILHNKFGKLVTIPDISNPEPVAPKVIEKVSAPLEKEKIEVVTKLNPDFEKRPDDDRVEIWCLPAFVKTFKDGLYGEEYVKVRYGNKFTFEAIVLDQDDLSFVVWTNTKAVTDKSVLFPRTQDKRWWRVQHIIEENDGYTIYCAISDYQPKFSE